MPKKVFCRIMQAATWLKQQAAGLHRLAAAAIGAAALSNWSAVGQVPPPSTSSCAGRFYYASINASEHWRFAA